MQKILIKIKNNSLCFSFYNKDTVDKKNINNTNIIDTHNIIFTDKYILNNLELVSAFLNVIVLKNNITQIDIHDYKLIRIVIDLINYLPNLTTLNIKTNDTIQSDILECIYNSKYITTLNCYNLSKFMFEKLNKKMNVNLRSEIFFISDFMKNNNLNTYSDIYYKKNIVIDTNLSRNDLIDLETFLKVNKHLKIININCYSSENIKNILEALINNNIKNIKINIYEKNENIVSDINYLKRMQNIVKNYKIKMNIIYSKEYKEKYSLKQVNLNIFMVIILIIIFTCIGIFIIYKNYDRNEEQEIEKIQNKVEEVKENSKNSEEKTNETDNEYTKEYSHVLSELKKINNETVGWLKVNNTNVNYPVVKHSDNNYYLKHSFSKKTNQNGWLFADYRNKISPLDSNTIIYGHNDGNIMFGSLKNVLKESWYTNTSNQIITFDSPSSSKWQIFSIYTTPVTNEYLRVNFNDDEAYSNFLNTIKNKSIYNFGIDVKASDKILTLSTCYNNSDSRLVIHAKKIG